LMRSAARARTFARLGVAFAAPCWLGGCDPRTGGDVTPIRGDGGSDATPDARDAAPDGGLVDASATDLAASCSALCSVLLGAGCPSDAEPDCSQGCEDEAFASPSCAGALVTRNRCLAGAPPSEITCDGDGFAAVSPSRCVAERAAVTACR
jgi:hypothetical protein